MSEPATADTRPFIPFAPPDLGQDEIDAVAEVLRSGWLTGGPKVREFEEAFRRITGAEHALALSSATAGLHLALLACDIGPGDEVITTPLTFAATVNVILHVGATPVLADICGDDYNLDPAEVERRVTPRTKALMPVHYGGQPCRMDELLDIARRHKLRVIEDAAHALSARYQGRPVGTIGDAAVFSFYPTKNITTGQGGMLTTNDEQLADRVELLRLHGLSKNAYDRYTQKGSWAYQVLAPGFNYVLTDVAAAIGVQQLARLDAFQRRRGEIAVAYNERFADLPEIIRPTMRDDVETSWHLYAIRLEEELLRINRDEFIEGLRERGVGTSVHYIPIHFHSYFRETLGLREGDDPVTERVFAGLVSLPLFPRMTDEDVERVAEAVHEVIESGRR
jgi:dTDP-4-amino-4,6-dideoxygalactose transaminase